MIQASKFPSTMKKLKRSERYQGDRSGGSSNVANMFLSTSIEECIESHDILLNILALVDRRVGKKRMLNMTEKM